MTKTTITASELTYAQMYYAKLKAKQAGITVEQYLENKNSKTPIDKSRNVQKKDEVINFDKVTMLKDLDVNEDMLKCNPSGESIDKLFSYDGGIPVGTNIMCTGDPGVGKTTILLHTLANVQRKNKKLKCLFVCGEMGKIQMFKYLKRFPVFGHVETVFASDFVNHNFKSVMEQLLDRGYDYVLIDSIAEVLETVKDDNKINQSQAEKWLIDICVKHNGADNKSKAYTTFLLIQQVTKSGLFLGSNKIKHITDAHLEMRRESEKDGGGTYLMFSKNRNGNAGIRFTYQLSHNSLYYGEIVDETEESETKQFELATK
jgi:predicted ATP-dependent serine protease